jgi:uncharacterized protein YneF (UPF0154 family)
MMMVFPVLLFAAVLLVGLGFVVGYFVGRRSVSREPRQGFPVLPPDRKGD